MIHVDKSDLNEPSPNGRIGWTWCGTNWTSDGPSGQQYDAGHEPIEVRAEAWGWRADCPDCLTKSRPRWIVALEHLYKMAKDAGIVDKWKMEWHP